MRYSVFLITGIIAIMSDVSFAAPTITDVELRKSAEELSASTLVDGTGWIVAERLLHPKYTRWAMGQIYEKREKFVRSLEEWWNYGMRVAKRDTEIIGVDITGDLAVVRYRTTESFMGPDGSVEGFSGYVSNTWIKEGGQWLLLSADISSISNTE